MEHTEATRRLLDAAETLFYQRGIQAVAIDEIRAESGVSLKRLYQCFPSKEDLVVAYLRRRDRRWRASLAGFVAERQDVHPAERPLLVFDWLRSWFSEHDFRGCAFINSFGELGATSTAIADVVREHKNELLCYLVDLLRVGPVGDPKSMAEQLLLLVDGAIISASVAGDPGIADRARTAAAALLSVSVQASDTDRRAFGPGPIGTAR